jgi:hypothetical protein
MYQLGRVAGLAGDFDPGFGEQSSEAFAHEHFVVGDEHVHGSSSRTCVVRSNRRHRQRAAEGADAVFDVDDPDRRRCLSNSSRTRSGSTTERPDATRSTAFRISSTSNTLLLSR